ncbi:Uncharacterised protein [Aggregatibacter aphrophilus]|uniref:Uncharacterized protein n=1 Tax=Aggregatibacter aphrophilus TaxID=732 RepID=A0A336N799_AGGAP|nr:Uncharacterised protein [Aggregatibacter aphrophilus]
MFIVDSHCHLDALDYENYMKILPMSWQKPTPVK